MTSCVSSSPIITKRGDTFYLVCTYKQNNVASSLVGYEIASQLRDVSGTLVATFAVEILDQIVNPGVFTLTASSTSGWPIGCLLSDIQFTLDGSIRSTQTFSITVQEDITRA